MYEFLITLPWWVYVLVGVIIGSIAFITRKDVLTHEHALEFTSFRSFINLILLAILSLFINLRISMKGMIFVLIIAVIGAWAILHRNKVVKHSKISEIAPLGGLGNLFVLVLGMLFLSEFPSLINFIGIIIIFLGVYVLEFSHRSFLDPFKTVFKHKELRMYLFIILLFSFTTILERHILLEENFLTVFFYTWFFISLLVTFKEVSTYGFQDLNDFKRDFKKITFITVIMFFRNILMYFAMSFPGAHAVLANAVGSSGSVIITFFGGRIFKEKHILKKTIATLIIVLGAILVLL